MNNIKNNPFTQDRIDLVAEMAAGVWERNKVLTFQK